MEPGVPFALLGAVLLLTVAACVGLAAAALVIRRRGSAVLVVAGALLLVAAETRTGLRLGAPASDDLPLARAAGLLLVGAGLYAGSLVRPVLPGVVVPLAAALPPSLLAGASGLAAAVGTLRGRRGPVGLWVASGLALWGVALLLAPLADHGTGGPLAVLLVRAAGSAAVLVGVALLAQSSLLTKVVTAILAGVVVMAVAAVGVVGSVVVSAYGAQSRSLVEQAAGTRVAALQDLGNQALGTARLAQRICVATAQCQTFLKVVVPNGAGDFVVRVPRQGAPQALAARDGAPPPSSSELLGLRGAAPVRDVLTGTGAASVVDGVFSTVQLTGSRPGIAVVAVVPGPRRPQQPPADALVYGVRLDDAYAARDLDAGGYGLSFLAGSPLQVVAANTSADERAQLLRLVRSSGADQGLSSAGRTIPTQGSAPTVRLVPLEDNDGQPVGLLALSRDARDALGTERDALRLLLITALGATAVVALTALGLGRRTVDPVRRLTAAAERVASGDLSGTGLVGGKDEVGTLTRTFDAMTGSLARLTDDLRASAVRLQTVLTSMSDGLLATDAAGTVTSVNRAALAMLGLEEADVLGEALGVVADVRSAVGTQLADPTLRLTDEPAEVHRPDGTTLPVTVALTGLEGGEGSVLVLRDTTREREVERMKTEFLSNVSHELRTPLTPIRGYAEILVARPEVGAEQVARFAGTIRDESVKMNRVVDLLVDVAAIEAGRVSVTPREVAVRDLLDERLAAWRSRAPQRADDLRRKAAAGLPALLIDPHWVGKALDELIDNAVKYTPAGTPITLAALRSPDGSRVRVVVRDAGPGIDERDQAGLFTSFEQVDGSATRRVGGLGLGLSFVRRLAEEAGFPVLVSSAVGKGSEFGLDLPVVEPSSPRRRRTA